MAIEKVICPNCKKRQEVEANRIIIRFEINQKTNEKNIFYDIFCAYCGNIFNIGGLKWIK
jgi:uncharacterized Zn-finger protein